MKIQYVIWGCGFRGRAIFDILGSERVLAFIDSDENLKGGGYCDKEIISFDTYLERYKDHLLVITPVLYQEIIKILDEKDVTSYFILNEECSELMGYGSPQVVGHVIDSLNPSECNVIYGINLMGLLLYEEMVNRGCKDVYLVPSDFNRSGLAAAVARTVVGCKTRTFEEIRQQADQIVVTMGRDKEWYEDALASKYKVMQAYDFSFSYSGYYNSKIEEFHNKHANSRCFIVATGFSLLTEDLDCLKNHNEIAFGLNRIFNSFSSTQWRPQYYMFIDRRGIKDYRSIIKKLGLGCMFIGDGYAPFWEDDCENMYKIHTTHTNSDSNTVAFSEDCSRGIYGGGTVTYGCIQLAVYMGFKEIYLLGVDCDYGQGKTARYFFSNGQEADARSAGFDLKENLGAYQIAKDYADAHGIKIYNASRGGKLEVFERVPFDDLF